MPYTYEYQPINCPLETYEWDNVWWEHTDDVKKPRVLYIGDSVSCGTRHIANAMAEGNIYIDGFGTSKALDNPYFQDALHLFAVQQGYRQVVLFNNGLHGWHLDDQTQYKDAYEEMIAFLLEEFPNTPLVLLLTTHVADEMRDSRVQVRNDAVLALAQNYRLPVIDLYTLTKNHAHLLSPDGVHFSDEGYQVIAREILEKLKMVLA